MPEARDASQRPSVTIGDLIASMSFRQRVGLDIGFVVLGCVVGLALFAIPGIVQLFAPAFPLLGVWAVDAVHRKWPVQRAT